MIVNIKEGKDIISNADFQNLITSVILRQNNSFTKKDVLKSAKQRIKGSVFEKDIDLLKNCIDDTLSILYLSDCVVCDDKGNYKLSLSFPALKHFQ